MPPSLGRLVLYVRDVEAIIAFYERYFDYTAERREDDRIIELHAPLGGANLMVHQAAKSQKLGQVLVKLVFDVEHVPEFAAKARADGLVFGPIHQGGGYCFANAKDPNGNAISISSRAFSASVPGLT